MKCGACGNENQPNAKFCVHCGAVLSQALPPSAATVPPRPAGGTIAPRPPPLAEPMANPSATATRPAATPPPPPPAIQAPSSPAPQAAASAPARVEDSASLHYCSCSARAATSVIECYSWAKDGSAWRRSPRRNPTPPRRHP